jgi:hypothetical protein
MGIEMQQANAHVAEIGQTPARRRRGGFLPALTLFFFAPLVGEVLLGSTPVDIMHSPGTFVFVFLLEALMYGGGAILIREVARRTQGGWPTILGLGLAYGIFEEGLITQSLFNPNYAGLHLLVPANLFGLGWAWIVHVLPLHMIWSISTSIALAELLFSRRGTAPWLGWFGLTVATIMFLLGSVVIALGTYAGSAGSGHFLAPLPDLLGALALAIAVAVVSLRLPRRRAVVDGQAPNPWVVGIVSFVAASLFMSEWRFYGIWPGMPGILLVALALVLMVGMLALVLRWSAQRGWGRSQVLALTAAAVLAYAWSGFFIIDSSDPINVVGQIVIDVLAVALLALLVLRTRRQPAINAAA